MVHLSTFLDFACSAVSKSWYCCFVVVVVGLLVPFRQNQLSMLTVIQNLFIRCVKQLIGKFLAARRIQGSSKSHFFSDRLLRKVPLFIFLKYVVTHCNCLFLKSLLLSCRILQNLAIYCRILPFQLFRLQRCQNTAKNPADTIANCKVLSTESIFSLVFFSL